MKIRNKIYLIGVSLVTFIVGVSAFLILRSGQTVAELPFTPEIDIKKDFSLPILESDEKYAVYSAILEKLDVGKTFIVSQHTSKYFLNSNPAYIPSYGLGADVINDYLSKNREIYRLEDKFTTTSKVLLLSKEEEDILFPKGEAGWGKFYRKYPEAKGLIYFSNVGFNFGKNQALVQAMYQCGNCRGNNDYFTLNKFEGKWLITSSRPHNF